MSLDRQKTTLQREGQVDVSDLTLRDIVEIVTDLGIPPERVQFEAWYDSNVGLLVDEEGER